MRSLEKRIRLNPKKQYDPGEVPANPPGSPLTVKGASMSVGALIAMQKLGIGDLTGHYINGLGADH
jgi:hypothetical protein